MSTSMCSGMSAGSASTWSSRATCCTTPPTFAPGASPTSCTSDRRLDRLVEPNLVEVDVRDRAADRVLLVVLEHGVMRRLLALDHDVDDPVQPGRAGQGDPQLPLTDDERLVRLAVEHAGDQALAAQALDVAGAELIGAALLDLEGDSVPGHGGEV